MDNPDLSLMFYNYLCDVIGTEEVVRMRRHIFTTAENVNSDKDVTWISSGSKAEGLDLDGSDIDIMGLVNEYAVCENRDKIVTKSHTSLLLMDTQECKPGFTRLQFCDNKHTIHYLNCSKYLEGKSYLSSTNWREFYHSGDPNLTYHGPCCSTLDGRYDFATCVRCNKWISQSKSWIIRSSNLYTSKNVINAIVEIGVLFVPIGSKNSPNEDLEWRISFSYAEKLLIYSFNHVQLLCYSLLKILLKEVIKDTKGDLLCSYFLKTIMLWISEESISSQWKPTRINFCFMNCLDRLIYFVRHKTLPHYFIPDNDLFAERFSTEQHLLLLSSLNQLHALGWICLLQTRTLQSFTSLLVPTPTHHLIHKTSYYETLLYLWLKGHGESKHELERGIYFCLRANVKDFYLNRISTINQLIGQTLSIENSRRSINKQSYNIIRKLLCHLLIGLNCDAVSGWLLLASHFYINKQYITCKKIISHCLLSSTPDKFMTGLYPSNEDQSRFTLLQRDPKIKPLDMTRTYSVSPVIFEPSSKILPKEMDMLDDGNGIYIPPVVYGCFLKYMCDHRLGNQTEKHRSLCELEVVIDNKYFIINDRALYKAHILLSVAYSLRDVVN